MTEAPLRCGCHGTEGFIPSPGWDPLNPSWEKTGTTLPYLPALTRFEDGTEEPWEGMHFHCHSYINH